MAPEKRYCGRSMFPDSQSFQKHAKRMRDFRLAHHSIHSAETGGTFSPFRRLSLILPRGIAVRLRNAMN